MSKVCVLTLLVSIAGCRAGEAPSSSPRVGDTRVSPDTVDVQGVQTASAEIAPVGESDVSGTVRLTDSERGVRVRMEVAGFVPHTRHGVQILHGRDCDADPSVHLGAAEGTVHGSPFRASPDRHAGDLGTLTADDRGRARYDRFDRVLRLDSTVSAVGRAVVVREHADDATTRPDGAAGAVVGCGVIEAVP